MLLLFALFCANIQTANVVYTRKSLEQNAALSLMTRVLYRMEEREDYVPGETAVVFVGVSDQLQEQIPGFEATYDITGCEEASPIEKALTSYNYRSGRFRCLEPDAAGCTGKRHALLSRCRKHADAGWHADRKNGGLAPLF